LVASFDAIDDAKNAVEQGSLSVTVDQLPAMQAYMGVETALSLKAGKTAPAKILVDVKVISKDSF
jgi:ABC-type sugar transport system substrate-binding protein